MSNVRAFETVRAFTQDGRVFNFRPEDSRLLVGIVRTLAEGRPVSQERVNGMAANLGVEPNEARKLLEQLAERDDSGSVVGILPGLSLNDHPHRFSVKGVQMSTWCAADTLGLPAVLGQTAKVESRSPVSGETIRLTVSPQRVEEASPAEAVVSIVLPDPETAKMGSAEELWGTFCHHIFFFVSREEAEQWAADRDDIEILSLDEGFELVHLIAGKLLAHA